MHIEECFSNCEEMNYVRVLEKWKHVDVIV